MRHHRLFNTAAGLATAVFLTAGTALPLPAAGGHSGGHSGGQGTGAAHGEGHGSPMGAGLGQPGKPGDASRTLEVQMYDNYYEPKRIQVEAGETVRFVIRNEGRLVHEFSLGTAAMHAAHQDEMLQMMRDGALEATRIHRGSMHGSQGHGMAHDDPNSVLLEPGQSTELVWQFPAGADLEFACNVPGHYQAGMVGAIEIDD